MYLWFFTFANRFVYAVCSTHLDYRSHPGQPQHHNRVRDSLKILILNRRINKNVITEDSWKERSGIRFLIDRIFCFLSIRNPWSWNGKPQPESPTFPSVMSGSPDFFKNKAASVGPTRPVFPGSTLAQTHTYSFLTTLQLRVRHLPSHLI